MNWYYLQHTLGKKTSVSCVLWRFSFSCSNVFHGRSKNSFLSTCDPTVVTGSDSDPGGSQCEAVSSNVFGKAGYADTVVSPVVWFAYWVGYWLWFWSNLYYILQTFPLTCSFINETTWFWCDLLSDWEFSYRDVCFSLKIIELDFTQLVMPKNSSEKLNGNFSFQR